MDVQDVLVLAFVLSLNVYYFVYYFLSYTKMLNAVAEVGLAFPELRWRLMLERVALIFGIMMWPNLWLLFLPIPQSSFLQQLTGLAYSQMIRYHRWIGHITMVVLTFHGWLYYIYWAVKHEFWVSFTDWDTKSSISFLSGSLAYFCCLVLWTSSIGWMRRRFFEGLPCGVAVFHNQLTVGSAQGASSTCSGRDSWAGIRCRAPPLRLQLRAAAGAELFQLHAEQGITFPPPQHCSPFRDDQPCSSPPFPLVHVFYRLHIVCFLGFTFFSYMHYYWSWSYFLPGLLLYAVDLVLRAGQLQQTTLITGATVNEDAGVATLQLKTSNSLSCPVHELFMLVPAISRWQWHPFTVAGTAPDSTGSGSTLTLHIKRYGKWSKDLMRLLQGPSPVPVRVSAPESPSGALDWHNHSSLVLIGGGIGVTPLLYMLRAMIAKRNAGPPDGQAGPMPTRVHLVWTSRQAHEFSIMDQETLASATSSSGWLTVELYCTGAIPNNLASDSGGKRDMLKAEGSSGGITTPAISMKRASGRSVLSSSMLHRFPRVVQPQALGGWHLALVHLLVWGGAFLGTYLGGAYVAEAYTYLDSAGIEYPNSLYWKFGMVWFFTQSVVTLALPFTLAVLPMHFWRYWRALKTRDSSEVQLLAPPSSVDAGHGAGSTVVGDTLTAGGEAGLKIKRGRPALRDTMLAAAEAAGPGCSTIGVYVGGPEGMTRQVQMEVSALNREGSVHFQFNATAHTL